MVMDGNEVRAGRLASHLVPLKGDLLRARWHTQIPYAVGALLIVAAWLAGGGGAIASEWSMTGPASALFGTIVMGVFTLALLSGSLTFHGIASEMLMVDADVITLGPPWLVRVYGTGGWLIMLATLWVVWGNVYETAMRDQSTWPHILDSVWVSIGMGFLVGYLSLFALGTLCGMLIEFGISSES